MPGPTAEGAVAGVGAPIGRIGVMGAAAKAALAKIAKRPRKSS
jgi:hypothetical protein